MKKGIFAFMCMLAILMITCITSCNNKHTALQTSEDSISISMADVAAFMTACENPSFTTVPDVVCEHESRINTYERDSVFRSMPTQTVSNVSQVLLKQYGSCTIQDIVDEYICHENIYKNLITLSENEDANTPPPAPNIKDSVKFSPHSTTKTE